MSQLLDQATKIIKDYFTSADGETYAVGRGLGIALFIFGLAMPTGLAVWMMITQKPELAEWTGFMGSLAAYIPALAGAVALLVWGTAPTEPKVPPPGKGSEETGN